jgi:murein DD-endopeptidase MepM/ murein hydrolase activator NlpD
LSNKSFTLIVVPDHHSEVRRFRLQKRTLIQALSAAGILALGLGIAGIHYVSVARDAKENRSLRDENLALKGELKAIRERVEHIGATLERVERFDQKLRASTGLSDPQRNLAMGPIESGSLKVADGADTQFVRLTSKNVDPKALREKTDKYSAEAIRKEQSLTELASYFEEQKSVLATTPSIWPVKGWITSDFGQRADPYTGEKVMHLGLDISGPYGKDVISPSDGTVVFAGAEGGYGNVLVIDHGYGIKTRYGHLASLRVKSGEKVKRGTTIAALGNTGRSTGPHLHYEVRVNGVSENPHKYILEDE